MRRFFARPTRRRAGLAFAALILAAMVIGFGGAIAPGFDSLSHFRAHLAALALLVALAALALRHWRTLGLSVLALALGLWGVWPRASENRPEPDAARYSLLQMNLLWHAQDRAPVLQRIADTQPDIITLQEMTPEWRAALAPLAESYPYQVHCPEADGFRGDSALLSRRPFVDGSEALCDGPNSLAAARIDFNGTSLGVVSHHQLWPWPRGQWRRLARLEETLDSLPRPLLIAADFNAAPWSALVAAYERATGTTAVEDIGPTWLVPLLPEGLSRWMGLPIDNILASPEVSILQTERLAATASDHFPVLVRFAIEAREPGEPETAVVALDGPASILP